MFRVCGNWFAFGCFALLIDLVIWMLMMLVLWMFVLLWFGLDACELFVSLLSYRLVLIALTLWCPGDCWFVLFAYFDVCWGLFFLTATVVYVLIVLEFLLFKVACYIAIWFAFVDLRLFVGCYWYTVIYLVGLLLVWSVVWLDCVFSCFVVIKFELLDCLFYMFWDWLVVDCTLLGGCGIFVFCLRCVFWIEVACLFC